MRTPVRQPQRRRCPVCGKPAEETHRPFCSDRCRKVDLGRWLTGAYVVPGPPVGEAEGAEDEETGR